MRLTKLMHR